LKMKNVFMNSFPMPYGVIFKKRKIY